MMAGEQFTDQEVAYMVRMLLRDQIDHEAVCVIARDRIEALVRDRAALRAKLEALAETYAASADQAGKRIAELTAQVTAAETQATALWRQENPGNDLVSPDLGALLAWLMERRGK